MTNEDWPESRARLLEDIERFSRDGPPQDNTTRQPDTPISMIKPTQPTVRDISIATPLSEAVPEPFLASGVDSHLLASLRQQAQIKIQGNKQENTIRAETMVRIGTVLEAAFRYLHDLTNQLNILKPSYPKTYALFGVTDFKDLVWQDGRADYRIRKISTEERIYEQITLRYRLTGPDKFCLTREPPLLEKVQKSLFDNSITCSIDETRNERGRTECATFHFPCEIKAGLVITGEFEIGKLRLRIRNVERFGSMEFRLSPEALTQQALDELACMLLGRSNQFTQLFERIG